MKTAGIVAEFNPLHNGHEYIINETRRLTGCESVCIAMSGDYVQRGEPALVDKWSRSEMALRAGADLVVEIPTLFCLGNAFQYANAGVRLLESIDKNISICCGSESGDLEALRRTADFIKNNRNQIEEEIKDCSKKGISYPAARELAISQLMRGSGLSDDEIASSMKILENPNDILALEYAIAAKSAEILVSKRKGAGYNEEFTDYREFQSAGGIRKVFFEKGANAGFELLQWTMPSYTIDILSDRGMSFGNSWTEVLRYAVMSMSAEEIEDCPSGGEGLGNLLKEAVMCSDSFEDIVMHCKSKRYTYTRISRLCMQVVLGIRRKDYAFSNPEYIRVLGFSEKGRELLAGIKKSETNKIPVITNINKESSKLDEKALKMLGLDVRAADVYNLVLGLDVAKNSDHRKTPILI